MLRFIRGIPSKFQRIFYSANGIWVFRICIWREFRYARIVRTGGTGFLGLLTLSDHYKHFQSRTMCLSRTNRNSQWNRKNSITVCKSKFLISRKIVDKTVFLWFDSTFFFIIVTNMPRRKNFSLSLHKLSSYPCFRITIYLQRIFLPYFE